MISKEDLTKKENNIRKIILIALILLFSTSAVAQENVLSLDAYIEQVTSNNDSFKSSSLLETGAKLREKEWELITGTKFFSEYAYLDDQVEPISPLGAIRTKLESFNLGFSKETDFGLNSRLYYNQSDFNLTFPTLSGIPGGFLPPTEYTVAGPVLELKQSLWRNSFGRETRSKEELSKAQVKAANFQEKFNQTIIKTEAEIAFWRLALSRELVQANKETLSRAERIKKLNEQRAQSKLADEVDALQARANFLARQLELKLAIDEERDAARQFNTLRGLGSEEVKEVLLGLDASVINNLSVPNEPSTRNNVKASQERKNIAVESSKLSREKNKPDLEIFGRVGMNGLESRAGAAFEESMTADNPTYSVGVRLSMPLNFTTLGSANRGYLAEESAAQLRHRRAIFEEERLWQGLNQRFIEAKERLGLAREIEIAQKRKLDNERLRQSRGRSTTFQVIQFEQDFASAQLSRIKTQAEILNLYAQLKTFGGEQ